MRIKLKSLIHIIHLWLGLSTGLVVFIISITGCIYAFQSEIQDATQNYRFTEINEKKQALKPSVFERLAHKALPNKHLHAINYPGKGRSVEAIFYNFEPDYYYIIYFDPYTSKVLKIVDMHQNFFHWILDGHFYLWLKPEIGQPLTSYSTLLFVFLLITGIILWWPKNKSAAKQRFWFKWKSTTQWKRKNYDLHNILGFYSSIILLVIAITGIFFGIQWFTYGIYSMAGGKKDLLFTEPKSTINPKEIKDINEPQIDKIYTKIKVEHPNALAVEIHTIESDSSVIAVNTNTRKGAFWSIDYRYFDQYSLKELDTKTIYGRIKDANFADKLIRMTYDIHTGGIFGFTGKLLAFLLSLVSASLPISGFLIWLGRRNKNKLE
jgi:uncharacterized iron-regulated membrane protein